MKFCISLQHPITSLHLDPSVDFITLFSTILILCSSHKVRYCFTSIQNNRISYGFIYSDLGLTQPLIQLTLGVSYLELNLPKCEADHAPS